MTTTVATNQANWCKRENIDIETLRRVLGLANAIARYGEHECNGDRFTLFSDGSDMSDKSNCASLWGIERSKLVDELAELVKPLGITVTLPGLYPDLRRGGHGLHLPFQSPQSITIIGRRWFDRVNGNTYNTADILVDGAFVYKTERQYGYGDHYVDIAKDWLNSNGFVSLDNGEPLWRYCQDEEIAFATSVSDVLKRDL